MQGVRPDNLPDGYPHSVTKPYGQPRSVKTLPEGDTFFLDRMSGWCACGRGERLNYGTVVVKRGPFLYLPACDPKPSINHCPCGEVISTTDVLCDRCYAVHQGLLYKWWRPVSKEIPRGFGITRDTRPVQAPHLAMRDHLRRVKRARR